MRTLLLFSALCLCCSCTRIHVGKTQCPHLAAYARREGIPAEVLREQQTQWPQYVYDYSVSHGPNLSKKELSEFTSWQVK